MLYTKGTSYEFPNLVQNATSLYAVGPEVTILGKAHSGATRYYGTGSKVTGRGASVTVYTQGSEYTGTAYYPNSSGSYKNVSLISVELHRAGSSATYYNGDGSTVTGRGDSVKCIDYDGILYEEGEKVRKQGEKISNDNLWQKAEGVQRVTSVGTGVNLNLATLTTRNATVLESASDSE